MNRLQAEGGESLWIYEQIAHAVTAPSRWLHVKCLDFPTAHKLPIHSYKPTHTEGISRFSTCGIKDKMAPCVCTLCSSNCSLAFKENSKLHDYVRDYSKTAGFIVGV